MQNATDNLIQVSYHTGRYNITEFLADNEYSKNKNEFFTTSSGILGPPTGEYLYKDWEDPISMGVCEESGGYSKEECETTASYIWENRNLYSIIEFSNTDCADEMNVIINNYFEEYKERNKDSSTPAPGIMGSAHETITFYVPKLQKDMPETLFSFGVWGYYASGGTMRPSLDGRPQRSRVGQRRHRRRRDHQRTGRDRGTRRWI